MGDRSLAYRIRHLDRDRTGRRGRGLAGYIPRAEMETLAKIFSVPEITNMPPTRRVHSFSANGSGMKLLKPIPLRNFPLPEWRTSSTPSHPPPSSNWKTFELGFSPGLASERNRITCCVFVDRIERLESRAIKRISIPFPFYSISPNIPWKVRKVSFPGKISRSRLFRGPSFIEGSCSLRKTGRKDPGALSSLSRLRCYGKTFN